VRNKKEKKTPTTDHREEETRNEKKKQETRNKKQGGEPASPAGIPRKTNLRHNNEKQRTTRKTINDEETTRKQRANNEKQRERGSTRTERSPGVGRVGAARATSSAAGLLAAPQRRWLLAHRWGPTGGGRVVPVPQRGVAGAPREPPPRLGRRSVLLCEIGHL
jgi:hypothetical protein